MALFGGSFDPPHRGHVAIARAAADELALDQVLFAPVGRQPLKSGGATASFADRLAMVKLVCLEDARFAASAVDAPRADGRPNYTIDTVELLKEQMPKASMFLLVGVDSFLQLPKWHRAEELSRMAEWIVVSRPGFKMPDGGEGSPSLGDAVRVYRIEDVLQDVSATELRRRLAAGETCEDALSAAVSDYIRARALYRSGAPG